MDDSGGERRTAAAATSTTTTPLANRSKQLDNRNKRSSPNNNNDDEHLLLKKKKPKKTPAERQSLFASSSEKENQTKALRRGGGDRHAQPLRRHLLEEDSDSNNDTETQRSVGTGDAKKDKDAMEDDQDNNDSDTDTQEDNNNDTDDDEKEEAPRRGTAGRTKATVIDLCMDSSSDDDDSDSDSEKEHGNASNRSAKTSGRRHPYKPAAAAVKRDSLDDTEDDSSDDNESEDESRAKPTLRRNARRRARQSHQQQMKKATAKAKTTNDDSDDQDSGDDEVIEANSDDESMDYNEEEEEESSEEEDDDDEDDEEELEIDSSEDEEEDDDDAFEADAGFDLTEIEDRKPAAQPRRRNNNNKSKPKKVDPNILPTIPKPMTTAQQQAVLDEIENDADQALQKLLFEAGFQFQLYSHQPLAVRRVAGVPDTFPLHPESGVTTPLKATLRQAIEGLQLECNQPKTRGLTLADAMGLGKTIECIAGGILMQNLAVAAKKDLLPNLLVAPNDAVMLQWRDALLKNGVPFHDIVMFAKGAKDFRGATWVLMTRFTAQAEMKSLFETSRSKSLLFPSTSRQTIKVLKEIYRFEKQTGDPKKRVDHRWGADIKDVETERGDDCVTRHLKHAAQEVQQPRNKGGKGKGGGGGFAFGMVIIDEAHFLKSRVSYWSMCIGLASQHAQRVLPATGTPYTNGVPDLATLQTFINPAEKAYNTSKWWLDALDKVGGSNLRSISKMTKEWQANYMLRRGKSAIAHMLPKKAIQCTLVQVTAQDIGIYGMYETKILRLMKQFQLMLEEGNNPIQNAAKKNAFQALMAMLSLMRQSLIHEVLPQGREVTKCFSPSRNLRADDCPFKCVVCNSNLRPSIPVDSEKAKEKAAAAKAALAEMRKKDKKNDIDNMEEGEEYDDDEDEDGMWDSEKEEEDLVPVPWCQACEPITHYCHESCMTALENMEEPSCPRCTDLERRICASATEPGQFWCKNIVEIYPRGIGKSPKLQKVEEWLLSVPKDDKIICVSFFKGTLDLVEAIMHHEHSWEVCRFDGDISSEEKSGELARFKQSSCRLLLMTVQSGGVGLNLVEANHLALLDRWFNPFVHAQAEDRIHRLGQKKDCNIVYFDTAATVDQCMGEINRVKEENAKVLLSSEDELDIKNSNAAGTLSYTELSGLVALLLQNINAHRETFLSISEENKMLPIPPVDDFSQTRERHQLEKDQQKARKKEQEEERKKKQEELEALPASSHGTADSKVVGENASEAGAISVNKKE